MDERSAQEIVRMVESNWRVDYGSGGRELWRRMLIRHDAALATEAVVQLSQRQSERPTVADLRGMILKLKADGFGRTFAETPALPPGKTPAREIPTWVKRWTAARYLYERFGREQDMRIFPEQKDCHPLGEMMPDNEWVEEGAKVRNKDVWQSIA